MFCQIQHPKSNKVQLALIKQEIIKNDTTKSGKTSHLRGWTQLISLPND